MTSGGDCIYCLDASVMIDLKDRYPRKIFKGLWEGLETLANNGRLITFRGIASECHDEVSREWFRAHAHIVKPFSEAVNDCMNQVLSDLAKAGKRMFNPSGEKDERDPFLVALALSEQRKLDRSLLPAKVCVLSQEKRAGSNATNLKIPNVCDLYGLTCVNLFELCEREGWEF